MPETPAGSISTRLVLPRRILRFASRIGFVLIAGILLIVTGYRLAQLWLVPEIAIAVPQNEADYISLFSALARVTDPSVLKVRVRSLSEMDVDAAVRESACAKDEPVGICRIATHDDLLTLARATASKPVRDPALGVIVAK